MKRCWSWLKRFLLHTAIFCMVAMVVLQGAVTLQPLSLFAGWAERMPDERALPVNTFYTPLLEEAPSAEDAFREPVKLTLTLQDIAALPHCRVLVNGEEAACFDEKQVRLSLAAGDLLEIDTTYYNFPVVFEITESSGNLMQPRLNQQFQVQQGIVWLGEVQTKS